MADQMFLPNESLQVMPSEGLSPVSPQAFGVGIGQALQGLGGVQSRIYHDHNATAAMAAANDLSAWTNEALYHPQTGVLHQESGADAPKVVDKTLSDYQAQVSKISSRLPNSDAQTRFQMQADEHALAVKRQLYGYEHAQVTDYANKQTGAFIANSRNAAVAYTSLQGPPSDGQGQEMKDGVATEIQKQQAAIADACRRNGDSDDVCRMQQAQAASETQMLVLEQFGASGQSATMKEWYQQHQDQLIGHDMVRAANMVRIGTDQDEARSIADDVLAKAHAGAIGNDGTVDQSKISLESALQDLEDRKIKDTGVYDQAKARVVGMFKLSQEAHKEVQADTMQGVVEHLTADNNPAHNAPYDLLAKLDPSNRVKMEKYQTLLRKDQIPPTNDAVWQDLLDGYKDQSRWEEFLQTKPIERVNDLKPADYARYEKMYAEVAGKVAKRDNTLSQGQVIEQEIDKLWKGSGLPAMPTGPAAGQPASAKYTAAAAQRTRFSEQLYRLVGAEQLKLKRDLTPPEIQEQADKLFAQQTWQVQPSWVDRNIPTPLTSLNAWTGGFIPAHIFDSTQASGPAFEAPGADKLARSIRDIKDADRATYEEKLRKAGGIVTEARLIQAYNADVTAAAIKAANAAP